MDFVQILTLLSVRVCQFHIDDFGFIEQFVMEAKCLLVSREHGLCGGHGVADGSRVLATIVVGYSRKARGVEITEESSKSCRGR